MRISDSADRDDVDGLPEDVRESFAQSHVGIEEVRRAIWTIDQGMDIAP